MNKYIYKIPNDKIKELIQKVRSYPTLYDCNDPKYSNNYEKARIWRRITEDLDLRNELLVRETWHKLKYFYKSVKTQIHKGQEPERWKYRKLMTFLDGNRTSQQEMDDIESETKRIKYETDSNSSLQDNDSLHEFFLSMYCSASLMPKLLQLQVKKEIFAALAETEEIMIGTSN